MRLCIDTGQNEASFAPLRALQCGNALAEPATPLSRRRRLGFLATLWVNGARSVADLYDLLSEMFQQPV
jgi:hypothetical protein